MLCIDSKRSESLENWLLNSTIRSHIRTSMAKINIINMDSIVNETDPSLRIIATKCYDGETGLVNISGWRGHLGKETPIILFTVLDKNTQSKWTRLVENPSPKRQTLKVKVPRSAVHHQVVATAELLREDDDEDGACATDDAKGMRRFTVESTSTCVVMAMPENNQLELLLSLCRILSTDESKKAYPQEISLVIERRSTDMSGFRLTKSTRGVTRWLISVEEVEASDWKDVYLFPAVQKTIDFEFQIEDGGEYHVEATGLDRTGGNIICRGSTNYKTAVQATTDLELKIEDGKKHHVEATLLDVTGGNIFCHGSTNHKTDLPATYGLDELRQLHQMAVAHAGQKNAPCVWLYRNKKPEYFREILEKQKDTGIMKPYEKDNSGDPRSPINGRIDGLFFMASVKPGSKTGEPITVSTFGKTRVLVPVGELLAKAPNLYFTDFYCMRGKFHYVTLVMTRPGSKADMFCAGRLLPLSLCDRSNNPFFFYDATSRRFHVSTKKQLIVELLFTEDLDIRGHQLMQTPIVAKGHSTNGGIPKNRDCTKCNLPTSSRQTSPTTKTGNR